MREQSDNASLALLRLSSILLVALIGCGSAPTGGISALDPELAAQAAIDEFDRNQDGVLSKPELNGCRGILSAWNRFDTDRSNDISLAEVAARITTIQSLPRTNMFASCQIFMDGKPLPDAVIRLQPAEYQLGAVRPAIGKTAVNGSCVLLFDDESQTEAERANLGIDSGIYRVEITHASLAIPAKYNSQSELGIELALDAGRNAEVVTFQLSSD